MAAAEAAVPKAARCDDGDDKENDENAAAAERKCGSAKLLLVQPSRVVMFVPGSGVRPFVFPTVLDGKASQMEVYVKVAQDAVVSALNGLNACVLAYGQTGSGKTHTTFGPNGTIEEAAACARRSQARGDGGGTRAAVGAAAERGRRCARARRCSACGCRAPAATTFGCRHSLCRFTTNTSPTSTARR